MIRDAEESNDEDPVAKRNKKKKKKSRKIHKSKDASSSKSLADTDELWKILSVPSVQRASGSKKRHSSGSTPKVGINSQISQGTLLGELSEIYYEISKKHYRNARLAGNSAGKEHTLEKDMFLEIRAKLCGYSEKGTLSLEDIRLCLDQERLNFNSTLDWLTENERSSSNCSPLLSVTRQLSRLSSPSLSQQSSIQLFSNGSNESRMNEVPCPKLLSCKIEEIKKAYFEITHKLDHFYHDLSRLYSSSISWMDLNFLHRSEEARTMLNSKIFYDGNCAEESSLSLAVSSDIKLKKILDNLESINAWCYFTFAALEKLHTLGKLISDSETSAFQIADLKDQRPARSIISMSDFVSRNDDFRYMDIDSQLKTFAETNADYASILPFDFRTIDRKKTKEGLSDRYRYKGPLMLVKSKLHELLLKMREALICEMRAENDLASRFYNSGEQSRVIVLNDKSFSFFDFTEFADNSSQNYELQIFDNQYLQEVCNGLPSKSKQAAPINYNPPVDLPSLLYLYVYLLRLERSICAIQIHDLKSKLRLDDSPAATCDRVEPENKVRCLVNIILVAVSEKVYISKLIMPFIGNLEFEAQRPDLFSETYQYEMLLREAFSDYSSYFYKNFTSRSSSASSASGSFATSPTNENVSSCDDDADGLLLFDKSFAIYHWRFTCKVLPYIAGGCHESVDAFRRAIKFYLDQISRQLMCSKEKFNLTVEMESYREESWNEVMRLHRQLKSYQLCLRNVTSFTRQVLEDLSICTLTKVQSVEKFFCSIKSTHTLIAIHDKYLNPSEFETHVNNQPACYLVNKRLLTNEPNVLKDLLLAIVNIKRKHRDLSGDCTMSRGSNSSSEKADCVRNRCQRLNYALPSLTTTLDSQPLMFLGQNAKLCSTLKSTPDVGGYSTVDTPTITPFDTATGTDSTDSKSSSMERVYFQNSDAYLLILNPNHISKWTRLFENDKPQNCDHNLTVLPPFYSFLPELTSLKYEESPTPEANAEERRESRQIFNLEEDDESAHVRGIPRAEQIMEDDEMILVSFSSAVAESVLNIPEFKTVAVKASQVPRYKSTRAEFESLYHSPIVVESERDNGESIAEEDDGEASSVGSGTMENLCDDMGSMVVLDRPIVLGLLEEIVDHLDSAVKVVNLYMEGYENRHKSPLNKHSKQSGDTLFSHCAKYLNILTVMAVQYARDISFIIPESANSEPRRKFSSLCLKLAHVLMHYVMSVLNMGAGQRSKQNSVVTAFLKLVAGESISQFFTSDERDNFKEEAKKMFNSIFIQQSSQPSQTHSSSRGRLTPSKSSSIEFSNKRTRRDARKLKSVAKSGVHFHNGHNTPDESLYDATDSVTPQSMSNLQSKSCQNFDLLDSFSAMTSSNMTVVEDNNNVVSQHGDALSNDVEDDYWSSSSEEDRSGIIRPVMSKMAKNREERNANIKIKINQLEEQLKLKCAATTGREVNKPTKNLSARILGIYVNFEFKTGRYLPKSLNRVSEAIKKGSDVSMAVKDVCFDRTKEVTEPIEKRKVKEYIQELPTHTQTEFENSITEVENLMKLKSCEHVVTFYGVAISPGHVYICMELFEQSLKTLAKTRHHENTFSPMDFRIIFKQIVQALKYIHSRDVIHMDIKAENIFLKEVIGNEHNYYLAKLGDFGLTVKDGRTPVGYGTPGFFALELFVNSKEASTKCDIWSLGCTVLQVFCNESNPLRFLALGRVLSPEEEAEEWNLGCDASTMFAMQLYQTREVRLPQPDPRRGITHDCVDFIEKCVQCDPKKRPSATQLCSHAFVC